MSTDSRAVPYRFSQTQLFKLFSLAGVTRHKHDARKFYQRSSHTHLTHVHNPPPLLTQNGTLKLTKTSKPSLGNGNDRRHEGEHHPMKTGHKGMIPDQEMTLTYLGLTSTRSSGKQKIVAPSLRATEMAYLAFRSLFSGVSPGVTARRDSDVKSIQKG